MNRYFTAAALTAALALGGACSRSAAPQATPAATPAQAAAQPAATAPATTAQAAHHEANAEGDLAAMTVAELAAMLERRETVAVYDNNRRERYEQGHIPTARHVGHDEVTAAVLPQDRNTRLVFYCYNEH